MSDRAVYLVGVAARGALNGSAAWRDAEGLEPGQATRVAAAGGFDALVIDVPAAMFTGDAAEARLKDVAWLAPRAEAHERLVRRALASATVMPVGFGSVFSGEAALAAALRSHAAPVNAYLDMAAGAAEWSVRATCDRAAALRRARESMASDRGGGGAGAAYLLSRSRAGTAELVAEEQASAAIDAFIEDLQETFRDVAERVVVADEGPRWTVAHLAFLVGDDARTRFDERLEIAARGLDASGIDIELSGPWPPYSFCPRLGDDADAEGLAA